LEINNAMKKLLLFLKRFGELYEKSQEKQSFGKF
jgi:hypothetical protein